MDAPRITQRDIALKAGVGRTTVSLALKDHPKISAETKARILKIAEQLGYQPDPMLSALADYRTQRRQRSFQGTFAWLVNVADDFNWKQGPYYAAYFDGAARRAEFHGYRLEQFELRAGALSPNRLASILRARSVRGILLCPQPRPGMEMEFPWDDFSVVAFGYSLAKPLMHTVASAHFLNTRHVMRELAARGYRRIGLLIDRKLDQRCGSNIYAGFLLEQELNPALAHVPPLFDYNSSPAPGASYAPDLARYLRQHRLQALVTAEYSVVDALKSLGLRVPEDIGVAGLSLPSQEGTISGIVEDSAKIGGIAIDSLVGMVQRGEYGVPPVPIRTHLEGTWREGATLLQDVPT